METYVYSITIFLLLFSSKISEGRGVGIVNEISEIHLALCCEEIFKIQSKNNSVDWSCFPGQHFAVYAAQTCNV